MWLRSGDAPVSVKQNYLLRITTYGVIFLLHVSLFSGQFSYAFWAFIAIQGLVYPHLVYMWIPSNSAEHRLLLLDAASYGVHLALWGFNPYLVSLFTAAMCVTYLSVGGRPMLFKAALFHAVGLLLGGLSTGWRFMPELPLITLVIVSTGFTLYLLNLGGLVYATNTKLRQARRQAIEQQEEMMLTNRLVATVNGSLDMDVILQTIMECVQRYYPFETLYMLPYSEDKKAFVITGIYGDMVSDVERSEFMRMQFNLEKDADSIFVRALTRNKMVYLPRLTPEAAATSAPVDQHLYKIKAAKSVLYVPVCVNNEVIAGAAFLNYEVPFDLEERDFARISQFLMHGASAVRNQYLIRELKTASKVANEARVRAEQSEEAKGRFLANMSHEIRTPLTAVLGYADLLTEKNLSPKDREKFTQVILQSGQHLLAMINDILDIAKIEAGKMSIEILPCSLVATLFPLDALVRFRALDKGLVFNLQLDYPIPKIIHTDATRLNQILINLLNNAVKFTQDGAVNLRIAIADNRLIFEVTDTGIGIADDQARQLFSAFTQADSSTTRLYGGTGLGLFVSKNIAQLLGGDIALQSQVSKGSTFTLSLPCLAGDEYINDEMTLAVLWEEQSRQHNTQQLPKLSGKILVAEDNPENQRLISHILQQLNVRFDMAHNGAQALAFAVQSQYDLFLLDLQMPFVGGKEAAEILIRQGVKTPIIAFTANVMTHQRAEYETIGFADILEKPFNRWQVATLLQKYLPEEKPLVNSVLVIDDDPVNQLLARQIFLSLSPGVRVREALTAEKGLEFIDEGEQFDLILMDLHLPGINGFAATEQLRQRNITSRVYILSANSAKDYQDAVINCGAQGFIEKPLNKQRLGQLLQS
jgi:signal transduction histidine kinase/CheY-like chemotaxis protein